MKTLTLTELRLAINTIKTSKHFQQKLGASAFAGSMQVLQIAEMYMLGKRDKEPQDPREVLTALGWKW